MTSLSVPLGELVDQLSQERRLVEYLLFKLVEAQLVLTADEARFVPLALAEVEEVMARIREAEGNRDRLLRHLAAVWGVPVERLTLSYLSERAPQPHRWMLEQHRVGFSRLADEIESVTRENRRLATEALGRVRSMLDGLVGDPATYTAHGRTAGTEGAPMKVDQVI